MEENIKKGCTNKEIFPEDAGKEKVQHDTLIETAQLDPKTIVLWIYNINQNGTANIFHEEMSQFFSKDQHSNILTRDMNPEMLVQFFNNITTAKEINMPHLGVRLLLFIYNCNQNGSNNTAQIVPVENSLG
ncbi:hypothetical protein [Desulfolucanica intricata]|uniref:hypothetical protein n=1 Tax=Desulfolucanica intricata TaxID=1285191 RepID=UPI00082B961B|nr:hypothetical protein [Desulfolucanica intricata]